MAQSNSKRKSSVNSKPKRKSAIFKIILTLVILGILAALAIYAYTDTLVERRLYSRSASHVSGIYSNPFEIKANSHIAVSALERELEIRQYHKVNNKPAAPGEYSLNGSEFQIYLRDFIHPHGQKEAFHFVRFDPEHGELQYLPAEEKRQFYLEPVLISPLGTEDTRASSFVALADLPPFVPKILLAAEDQRFYEHFGIDLLGLSRAMLANLAAGRVVQGGSTITQQLAKNLFFSLQKTFSRKFLEAFAAINLEQRLTKNEILEFYINEVYLGQEGSVAIHGLPAACRTYFRKSIKDITPSETAMLVGIIKAPSFYSPRRNYERSIERRDVVLKQTLEEGVLTEKQYRAALLEKPEVIKEPLHSRQAQHFSTALESNISLDLNIDAMRTSGVQVYTGLQPTYQRCAEAAVKAGIESIEKERPKLAKHSPKLEAGLVAIESYSGLIRAWVGGRDYSENQFDHVNQANRQIGSIVKPFVYLTGFDPALNSYKPLTASLILSDRPYEVAQPGQPVWRPENYDKEYRGDVSARFALENSLNIPAAYVTMRVGPSAVARTLGLFRIGKNVQAVPSIALGAIDANLLEMTAAYAALSNGGIYVAPRLYSSILDQAGNVIQASQIDETRLASEDAVYVLTNVMQGVIERGTGQVIRRLGFTGTAAGKTGTSNDQRDSWFVGFTPGMAVGAWVGFDNNDQTGLTGASGAARIWTEYMKCAQPLLGDQPFVPPPGVHFVDVDASTGTRITEDCPAYETIREVFVRGTEPEACRRPVLPPEPQQELQEYRDLDQPGPPRRQPRRKGFWDVLFGD